MAKNQTQSGQFPLTPPVGYPVLWYDRGDRASGAKAALVTGHELPGAVKVVVFGPDSEPRYYKGVKHITEAEKAPHEAQTVRCGGWDWVEGLVAKDAERVAREAWERKELARLQEEEEKDRRAKERAEAEKLEEEPANA